MLKQKISWYKKITGNKFLHVSTGAFVATSSGTFGVWKPETSEAKTVISCEIDIFHVFFHFAHFCILSNQYKFFIILLKLY